MLRCPTPRAIATPPTTTFGRLARAARPPAAETAVGGLPGLLLAWKIVGGLTCALLWTVHIGLNIAGSRESRRAELHADMLAARTAGSRATTAMMEVLSGTGMLAPFVSADAQTGRAAQDWHESIASMRERKREALQHLLRRSKRMEASLFASHPSPGARHEFVGSLPHFDARVGVSPSEAERIDRELSGIAEHMLAQMKSDWG